MRKQTPPHVITLRLLATVRNAPGTATALCVRLGWSKSKTPRVRAILETAVAEGFVYVRSWRAANQPVYAWRTSAGQKNAPRPAKWYADDKTLIAACEAALIHIGRGTANEVRAVSGGARDCVGKTMGRLVERQQAHIVGYVEVVSGHGAKHLAAVYAPGAGVSVPHPNLRVTRSVFDQPK